MKLYIETMGCPKNFNDSESIGGIWESTGMSLTDDPAEADAILVNTCGFINDAKQESIGCIFDMARFIDESAKQAPDHEKKMSFAAIRKRAGRRDAGGRHFPRGQ